MVSQAEKIITFVFNRSGKTELPFSEMYLTLSMDLNWFTPDDAKEFVEKAIKNNLLKEKNNQISPLFDVSKVNVPVGYTPTGEIFENNDLTEQKQKEESILNNIIDEISKETEKNKKDIFDEIKIIEKEKNIEPEIASLIVGKKYDIKLDHLSKKIEKKYFLDN